MEEKEGQNKEKERQNKEKEEKENQENRWWLNGAISRISEDAHVVINLNQRVPPVFTHAHIFYVFFL